MAKKMFWSITLDDIRLVTFSSDIFLSHSYKYQITLQVSENTYNIFRHLPKMRMHVLNK